MAQTQQQFQDRLQQIDLHIKSLKQDRNDLITKMEKEGYYVKNGAVMKDESVVGFIQKWLYYSKYVGETGAMYDYDESAELVKGHDFKSITDRYFALRDKADSGTATLDDYTDFFEFVDEELHAFGQYLSAPGGSYDRSPDSWSNRGKSKEQIEARILEESKDFFEMFNFDPSSQELTFRYRGGSDQGEYVDKSGFTLSVFSRSYITKYKGVSESDSFDYDSDEVDW